MSQSVVVVGAGQAGGEIAVGLRRGGFEGRITLVGAESEAPYRRPPLSKAFLAQEVDESGLVHAGLDTLSKQQIEFVAGVQVVGLEVGDGSIHLSDGRRLQYDQLALATGGRARRLSCPGADLDNILYLRTLTDAKAIRSRLIAGRRLLIVGGGFVGLEVAATARALGLSVTLLETGNRILRRAVGPDVAGFLAGLHRDAGVELHLQRQVKSFVSKDSRAVSAVVCEDGGVIEADLVVVGIGLIPNDELAARAGLDVDNGIMVDQLARTSNASVVAAGDCTYGVNDFLGRRIRLESVQNALEQARAAVATMLGISFVSSSPPTFWTEQYGLKMQMIGVPGEADRVVIRGSMKDRSFAAFYLGDDIVQAVHLCNRQSELAAARKLVADRCRVDPGELERPSSSLQSLVAEAAV